MDDDQQRKADGDVNKEAHQHKRDDRVAAAETVSERIQAPEAQAEARQSRADGGMAARTEQQRAEGQRHQVEDQFRRAELQRTLPAVDPAEVGDEHIARAEAAQVHVEDEVGSQHGALQAADAISEQSGHDGKDPVFHSLSPF